MRDLLPVALVTGVLLVGMAVFMVVPILVDLEEGRGAWQAFAWSGGVTLFVGGALAIAARGQVRSLSLRATFLLTVVSWLALVAFAALPFYLVGIGLSPAESFFESMSGLTTTGSTVITGLDTRPRAILIWRAILQWIGGVGIVVTGIALLPILQVGGMQLFRMESSDASDKLMPRATQIAAMIGGIYVGLTALCALVYAILGMSAFNAIAHAMTTIATGGFSTSDGSMGTFMEEGADIAAVFFMLAGGVPFGVYMLMLRGDWRSAARDGQTATYLGLAAALVLVMTLYLAWGDHYSDGTALRYAAFNVVSVLTGTGYATTDYGLWGPFAVALFFVVMFIGGCAGSTSCGLKIFRLQVAFIALRAYATSMIRPHAVETIRYNGRPLGDDAIYSVLSFIFLFFATFAVLAIIMAALGYDTVTAISAAATSVANVGPGLGGEVGPAGTFAELSDAAKWVLAIGMLIGRLEVFTIFVLFTATFWRR